MATAKRSERLREDLHVALSAALAANDGGERAMDMDHALKPPGETAPVPMKAEGLRTRGASEPVPEAVVRIAESPEVLGALGRIKGGERRGT